MRDGEGVEWKEYLRAAVLFLVLAPNGNHQQDMLFRVAEYKKLEELPEYKVGPFTFFGGTTRRHWWWWWRLALFGVGPAGGVSRV